MWDSAAVIPSLFLFIYFIYPSHCWPFLPRCKVLKKLEKQWNKYHLRYIINRAAATELYTFENKIMQMAKGCNEL